MLTSPWPSSKIRIQTISPLLAFKCAWMPVNSAWIFVLFWHCLKTNQWISGWLLGILPVILNSPTDLESVSWNSLLIAIHLCRTSQLCCKLFAFESVIMILYLWPWWLTTPGVLCADTEMWQNVSQSSEQNKWLSKLVYRKQKIHTNQYS